MGAIGVIIMVVGVIIALVGAIWLLILAFQESVLWGLGCIFIPFVSLVFVIMHWPATAKPFGLNVGGIILYVLGTLMAGTRV